LLNDRDGEFLSTFKKVLGELTVTSGLCTRSKNTLKKAVQITKGAKIVFSALLENKPSHISTHLKTQATRLQSVSDSLTNARGLRTIKLTIIPEDVPSQYTAYLGDGREIG